MFRSYDYDLKQVFWKKLIFYVISTMQCWYQSSKIKLPYTKFILDNLVADLFYDNVFKSLFYSWLFHSFFLNEILWKTHNISESMICTIDFLEIALQSSCSQMFFKLGFLKSFSMFTLKHLCLSLILMTLQGYRPPTLLQRDSNTVVFLWVLRNF